MIPSSRWVFGIIFATDEAGGFAKAGGGLPWDCPEDLKHFKRTTMGHPVIMGRRTYESLPGGPLKGRVNIVVSQDSSLSTQALVMRSLNEALGWAYRAIHWNSAKVPPFVIGGAQLIREAAADGRCTSIIHSTIKGDFGAEIVLPVVRDLIGNDRAVAVREEHPGASSRGGALVKIEHWTIQRQRSQS